MDINSTVCSKCGGKGFKFKQVGGKPKKFTCSCQKEMLNIETEITVSEDDLFEYIPNILYHDDINTNKISEGKEIDYKWEVEFKAYLHFLRSFSTSLKLGRIPTKSYFVVAPPNFGKKFFIYNCIKNTLIGGKKPTKLLDTSEISELYTDKKYKDIKKYFIDYDVIFMTVGNSPNINDVLALKHMMDLADRYGKPLIVISRNSVPYYLNFDANMISELGVTKGYKYNYGVLELQGFSAEFMKDYFTHNSRQVRKLLKGDKYQYDGRKNTVEVDEDDVLNSFSKKTLGEETLDKDDSYIDDLMDEIN